MSAWTVKLLTGSTVVYTFPATPFATPSLSAEWSSAEPSLVTAITKRYKLQGVIHGDETTTGTAWASLLSVLSVSGSSQIDGVELRRDSTVVDSIKLSDGWKGFTWNALQAERSDPQWRGELRFSLEIAGRKRFALAGYPDPTISSFESSLEWSYDEAGLLTQTYAGTLETTSGSAVAAARLCTLSLPSSSYAYVTKGPEGVDVTREDEGDLKASFRSVIRQSGAALPSGVGPSYSVIVDTVTHDGETTVTTTVSAVGPGASSAVQAQIPPGSVASKQIVVGANDLTARGVFVQKSSTPDAASATKTQKFTITGGGRPLSYSRRSGGRAPLPHLGAWAEVEVTETLHLEQSGVDGANFSLPAPLEGIDLDTNASRYGLPERTVQGSDRSGDRYSLDVVRVYRAPDALMAFLAAFKSVLALDSSSTLAAEVLAQGNGEP